MKSGKPESPLDQLPYFVSWSGEAALSLAKTAFDELIGNDLTGMNA